jgi:hypothetical protein
LLFAFKIVFGDEKVAESVRIYVLNLELGKAVEVPGAVNVSAPIIRNRKDFVCVCSAFMMEPIRLPKRNGANKSDQYGHC